VSTETLIVRDFELRDVSAANALTNHFIEHTTIHFGADRASDEAFEAYWREGRARHPWLVGELDGRFAGYCKASAWRARAAYARTAETGIYVEPHARGRGVGTSMYRSLLDRLRADGFRTIVAGIALPNEASVRLHEAVGFTKVGVFREAGFKLGAWIDVGFWQLGFGS
jgi:phosphinothricin acetyltransferase